MASLVQPIFPSTRVTCKDVNSFILFHLLETFKNLFLPELIDWAALIDAYFKKYTSFNKNNNNNKKGVQIRNVLEIDINSD